MIGGAKPPIVGPSSRFEPPAHSNTLEARDAPEFDPPLTDTSHQAPAGTYHQEHQDLLGLPGDDKEFHRSTSPISLPEDDIALRRLFGVSSRDTTPHGDPSASTGTGLPNGAMSGDSPISRVEPSLGLGDGGLFDGLRWNDQAMFGPGGELDFDTFLANLGIDISSGC
jgi:hypothetical protein